MKSLFLVAVVLSAVVCFGEARPRERESRWNENTYDEQERRDKWDRDHKNGEESSSSDSYSRHNANTGDHKHRSSSSSSKKYSEGKDVGESNYYHKKTRDASSDRRRGRWSDEEEEEEREDSFAAVVQDYVAAQVPDERQQRTVTHAAVEHLKRRIPHYVGLTLQDHEDQVKVISLKGRIWGLLGKEGIEDRTEKRNLMNQVLERLGDDETPRLSKLQEVISAVLNGDEDEYDYHEYEENEEESLRDRVIALVKQYGRNLRDHYDRKAVVDKAIARVESRGGSSEFDDDRLTRLVKYLIKKQDENGYYNADTSNAEEVKSGEEAEVAAPVVEEQTATA